jgi:hypothetical protein
MTANLDDRYQKGYIASDPPLDPPPQIRIVNIKQMIENDKLTEKDVFKRTYLGHARMSSAFVFQGTKDRLSHTSTLRMTRSALCCRDQEGSPWAG